MYNSIAKGMRILNKRSGKNKTKKYLRNDSRLLIDRDILIKGRKNKNTKNYLKNKLE